MAEEKTTQPRLYKRGNDDINLDEYIRNAEAEFDFWLANSRLKDKQKKEVRDAYSQLLQGISEGKATYKIGGGYNNSIGMNNASKGFDAAGLAAGFLGSVLRQQNVYTAPTITSNTPKIKYEGAKTVGADALKSLLGDAGNIQYFINQDELVDGKRGHTNRIKLIQDYLNNIANNWDSYFKGYDYTPEQKEQWFNDYNKYGKNIDLNRNGLIDENKYLGLSKLFGLNNIEQLLYTGQTYGSQPQQKTYQNEEEYLNAVHPRSSTPIDFSMLIKSDKMNYLESDRQQIVKFLSELSDEKLFTTIQKAINTPLNTRVGKFTNNYILSTSLEIARRKGLLNQFSEGSNQYYIPLNSEDFDNKSIGIVYQISPDGNHKLSVMDRRDIPYFTNQWHNEFTTYVPSHKNGGILKFDGGGKTGILTFNPKRNNIYFTGNFSDYDNWHANNIILPWLNAYQNAGDQDWETVIKSGLDSWNNAGGFDWYNATDEQRQHGMQSAGTQAHQQYVIDNLPGLNTEIAKHLDSYNVPARANTNDRFVDGALQGTDTDFGIQTGNRRPTIHIKTTGQDLTNWDNYFKNLGYVGRYQYLDHWVPTKNADQEGIVTFEQSTQETPQETPQTDNRIVEQGSDTVNETNPPQVTEKYGGIGNILTEYGPDLLGAGRLWASLRANNRVYRTVLPSLKPVLKDTYERFSPVTGAFSAMQLKNRQGAETLSQSYRPFTSDASLAAARMLEGQKYANQLQTEGFLADDQEIKRTKAEALARTEDNMARRSEVANFNRASINQTNREKAQLKASQIKSNWQSWDNFLSGIESRWLQRAEENRALSNQFREQIAMDNATRWYNRVMEDANKAKDEWIRANTKDGVTPDITTWGNNGSLYAKYDRMRKLAEDMKTSMLKRDMANIYGMRYTSIYDDDAYNKFMKW